MNGPPYYSDDRRYSREQVLPSLLHGPCTLHTLPELSGRRLNGRAEDMLKELWPSLAGIFSCGAVTLFPLAPVRHGYFGPGSPRL